jgi:hypothetical protein
MPQKYRPCPCRDVRNVNCVAGPHQRSPVFAAAVIRSAIISGRSVYCLPRNRSDRFLDSGRRANECTAEAELNSAQFPSILHCADSSISGSEQMRILLVCFTLFTLASMGLAISPVAAHPTGCCYGSSSGYFSTYHYHPRYSLYSPRLVRYEACSCHYGYEDGYSLCAPAVSCYAEGGRCRATCAAVVGY